MLVSATTEVHPPVFGLLGLHPTNTNCRTGVRAASRRRCWDHFEVGLETGLPDQPISPHPSPAMGFVRIDHTIRDRPTSLQELTRPLVGVISQTGQLPPH